jgi:uncharacterized membrane protein
MMISFEGYDNEYRYFNHVNLVAEPWSRTVTISEGGDSVTLSAEEAEKFALLTMMRGGDVQLVKALLAAHEAATA